MSPQIHLKKSGMKHEIMKSIQFANTPTQSANQKIEGKILSWSLGVY